MLAGSPQYITDTLQRVLNAASRLVSGTRKFDQGLSRLLHDELHWLNVSECSTSWQWWFTGAFKTKHRSTWLTAASQCLMSPVDSTCDLPVVTSWPFCGSGKLHSAVNPSLLGVRWHRNFCQTISVIQHTSVAALGVMLRLLFSQDTSVLHQTEMLHDMRYINWLLALTLTLCGFGLNHH